MSEYRRNPLTGQWVVIAENRAVRPNEFVQQDHRRTQTLCPFCQGNERQTPDSLAAYPSPEDPQGWQVRVVPNKYPALTWRQSEPTVEVGPYQRCPAGGIHEIVIESPDHVASLTEISSTQLLWSMIAYRDRIAHMSRLPGIQHGVVFKNCRPEAGASLQHVHSQVMGTHLVASGTQNRLNRGLDYQQQHGKMLLDVMVEFELADQARIVARTPHFVAFCPFASRWPYEIWVVPRPGGPPFPECDVDQLKDLGGLIREAVTRLESALGDPAYNLVLQLPPFQQPGPNLGWCWELFPRLTKVAGFEWSTGCMINPVAPETAARRLRDQPGVGASSSE